MAHKAIREADGKKMMARLFHEYAGQNYAIEDRYISIGPDTDLKQVPLTNPWVMQTSLVVKPDQLIKRRGKNGMVLLNKPWSEAETWIREHMNQMITIGTVSGTIDHFIVEPFIPHQQQDEYYVSITSVRNGDTILFYHEGGINVGNVDEKAERWLVPTGEKPTEAEISQRLLGKVAENRREVIAGFIRGLFGFYADINYAFLEVNPFIVINDKQVLPLDLAAKLDTTAEFVSGSRWGEITFPSPFGRNLTKEEEYIEELDSMTGASLKLTVLNPKGRIWTMVAGGGASVIFADTITDLGFMSELANYGEYSGDPNEEFTYKYSRTILDLMTREKHPLGKYLFIGGGIANFTDVAATFKGIIRALKEYKDALIENKVKIYVRRGGPNYKEGLRQMREQGATLRIPIAVYGPETHMTHIVALALKEGK